MVERNLHAVAKFYCLLPEDTIKACLESLSYPNRDIKRKYAKIKNVKERLTKILTKEFNLRLEIASKIYDLYKDKIIIEDDTYESIINSYNKDNCIHNTIYILYKCSSTETDFDNKYFEDFIKSEQFLKTIENRWDEDLLYNEDIVDNEEPTDNNEEIIDIEKIVDNIIEENINTQKEEGMKSVKYYIGDINKYKTFYNFNIKFVIENNRIDVDNKYVNTAINIGYEKTDLSETFLNDIYQKYSTNSLFAVKFEESELKVNYSIYDDTKIEAIPQKLNLANYSDSESSLKDIVRPAHELNVYKVVTSSSFISDIKEFSNKPINILESYCEKGEQVLLSYGGNLYGPYEIDERPMLDIKFIMPNVAKEKYLLKYYPINSTYCEKTILERIGYIKDDIEIALIKSKDNCMIEDIIPDEVLLSKVQENVNFNLLKENPAEFKRLIDTSPFLGNLDNRIKQSRIAKVIEIVKSVAEFEDEKQNAILSLIDTDNEIVTNFLNEKYKQTKNYADQIEENNNLQKTKDKLEQENIDLKKEVSELQKSIESVMSENSSSDINNEERELYKEQLEGEIEEIKESKEKLEAEIISLKEKRADISQIIDYKKEIEELKQQFEYRSKDKFELERKLDSLQSQVVDAIRKGMNDTSIAERAFDPYISNAMIEAASEWRTEYEFTQYGQIAEEMRNKGCSSFEKIELLDSLISKVQKYRNYTRNDIINMYICISQSFLTVFSGEPGTGKTSICNILGASLGLNNFGETGSINKNRYIPVSVERGWTSKRDLIGYFNPLTKKYDRNNAKIYDALMIMDSEGQNSRFPYMILLDEANLSPIEYYWADFMRVADRNESNCAINIGTEKDIYITKTLRFLATINNDQTTTELSPRLIDRAWIVKLPKSDLKEDAPLNYDIFDNIILWEDIEKTFVNSESKELQLNSVFEQICKLFDSHNLTVSPRVKQSIKNYVRVAQEIMDDEPGKCSKEEKALDYAIVQKLMPKINGYLENYRRLFDQLKQVCEDNHLDLTKASIKEMEDSAEANMGYCKYLI